MSVQVFANGNSVYDSRLPVEMGYSLLALKITDTVNKGGTATVTMPPQHPCYTAFPALRTSVEVYRDDVLRWRGRPLMHADDLYGRRTVTCEGELCFLRDAVHRPYLYQASPEEIFTKVMQVYNAAVEPWKQFTVGLITVKDANDYIRFESTTAESIFDTVQKLIERCGGYVLFDSAENGQRRINWYASLPYRCNQTVQYGENLLDLENLSDASQIATRIIPYGAEDADGKRVTIDIDGKDYVENPEAIALRGVIEAAVTWQDVTDPANLQRKAVSYVASAGMTSDTLSVTAIDLSKQRISLDAFQVGQLVSVIISPHGIDAQFGLTAMTENLLDPADGDITLTGISSSLQGADNRTLSGALATAKRNAELGLAELNETMRENFQANIAVLREQFSSAIDQFANEIRLKVTHTEETANSAKEAAEKAVISSVPEFYLSDSPTEPVGGEWTGTQPAWQEGKYIWTRQYVTYGNETSEYTPSETGVCITGNTGANGKNGSDAVLLMIDSTNGNIFKNSGVATILTVTIIVGDITISGARQLSQRFGAAARLIWSAKKMGQTEFTEIPASDPRLSDSGFLLALNPEDVETKAVFQCALDY